jgi:hypothetical protein
MAASAALRHEGDVHPPRHRGWADPDVIETRVTHTRKARNVFDGYNRGLHWERTCSEILKLRITRGPQTSAIEQPLSTGGGHEPLPFACSRCKWRI